jgi:hypothetical protein
MPNKSGEAWQNLKNTGVHNLDAEGKALFNAIINHPSLDVFFIGPLYYSKLLPLQEKYPNLSSHEEKRTMAKLALLDTLIHIMRHSMILINASNVEKFAEYFATHAASYGLSELTEINKTVAYKIEWYRNNK